MIEALDGLGAITLFTEDLARSAAFYRDVVMRNAIGV